MNYLQIFDDFTCNLIQYQKIKFEIVANKGKESAENIELI